ncbi:MAG: formylglycine-generating enzyme family protein [Candidatus Hydrogenedentales bacterium]
MGSPDAQPGRGADEGPVHAVTIDQGFWISRREISQKEYALVMNERPSAVQREEMPVTNVSWLDAMAFCAKLSADSGAAYSLPTEAQWEYAARAGGTGAYHFRKRPDLAGHLRLVCRERAEQRSPIWRTAGPEPVGGLRRPRQPQRMVL